MRKPTPVAFRDWPALIAKRKAVLTAMQAAAVVGDVLDTPPPAGQEKPWLTRLVDEAAADVKKAETWAISKLADRQRRAKEALRRIKDMLSKAQEAAKQHAPELLPKIGEVAGTAGKLLAGLGVVVLAPMWLPVAAYVLFPSFRRAVHDFFNF